MARAVVKVRYAPFTTVTHGAPFPAPGNAALDPAGFEAAARAALAQFPPGRPVRLLGVRAEFAKDPAMTDAPINFAAEAPTAGSLDVRWIHGAPARRRPRPADPGPPVRPAHGHHAAEQVGQLRGPVPVPALRQRPRAAARHRRHRRPGNVPAPRHRRPLISRLAGRDRQTARRLRARRRAHPRPRRPRRGRRRSSPAGRTPRSCRASSTPSRRYFGFTGWPDQIARVRPGRPGARDHRQPGHHRAAITVYDPWTGFLLTGDTVYPGRLYAFDFPQFVASLDRMVALAESRPVTHVLGCHIEMTSARAAITRSAPATSPDEPPLEMTVGQLLERSRRGRVGRRQAGRAPVRRLHHLQRARPPRTAQARRPCPRAQNLAAPD